MLFLAQTSEPNYIGGILALGLILALYLLPTIIAVRRGHHQVAPIAVINIVFGWTLLGWVAALAWSVSSTLSARTG